MMKPGWMQNVIGFNREHKFTEKVRCEYVDIIRNKMKENTEPNLRCVMHLIAI